MARAVLADEFGEAGNEAVAHGQRGFGGDVAGSEAGPACGDNELRLGGSFAEGCGELGEVVGEYAQVEDGGSGFGKELRYGWAGDIGLRAGVAAVAGGDDDGRASLERCWHGNRIQRNRGAEE